MSSSPVLGIDLGTTNSVVAVADAERVHVFADDAGQRLTPSTVSFHPSGEVLVGAAAVERRLVDASNTVASIKRLIGRPFRSPEVRRAMERFPFTLAEGANAGVVVKARGETYSLPEISAFVLRRLKAIAEQQLQQSCASAVVTVPANFNELQRTATRDAGRIAGLNVLRILNEPTAAALAYGYGARASKRIAVYDLGGGTFDVSVLDMSGDVIEVIATAGDSYLGGDDVDAIVADQIASDFLREYRIDLHQDSQAMERLRMAAEWLKCELSDKRVANATLEQLAFDGRGNPIDYTFVLTREKLEECAFPLVGRTFDICEEAMQVAQVRPAQLDGVVLVGGQTRSPQVRRMVAEYFDCEPEASLDPDQVVAQGAALQALALSGQHARTRWKMPTMPPATGSHPAAERRFPSSRPPARARAGGGVNLGDTARGVPPAAGANAAGAAGAPVSSFFVTPSLGTAPALPATPARSAAAEPQTDGGFDEEPTRVAERAKAPAVAKQVPAAPPPAGSLPLPAGQARKPNTLSGMGKKSEPPPPPAGVAPVGRVPLKRTTLPPPIPREATAALRIEGPGAPSTPASDSARAVTAPPRPGGDPARVPNADKPAPPPAREAAVSARAPEKPAAAPAPPARSKPAKTRPSVGAPGEPAQHVLSAPPAAPKPASVPPRAPLSSPLPPALMGDDDWAESGDADAQSVEAMEVTFSSAPSAAEGAVDVSIPRAPRAPSLRSKSSAERQSAPALEGMRVPPPDFAADLGSQPPLSIAPPVTSLAPDSPPRGDNSATFQGLAEAVGFGGGEGATPEPRPSRAPARSKPPSRPAPPLLLDVTPRALAIETAGGYCEQIVPRNAPIPTEQSRVFTTSQDRQIRVSMRVCQGEARRTDDNEVLGELELVGLREAPRGAVSIGVTFVIDADGLLRARAQDKATGKTQEVRINLVGALDDAEIERMRRRQEAMMRNG